MCCCPSWPLPSGISFGGWKRARIPWGYLVADPARRAPKRGGNAPLNPEHRQFSGAPRRPPQPGHSLTVPEASRATAPSCAISGTASPTSPSKPKRGVVAAAAHHSMSGPQLRKRAHRWISMPRPVGRPIDVRRYRRLFLRIAKALRQSCWRTWRVGCATLSSSGYAGTIDGGPSPRHARREHRVAGVNGRCRISWLAPRAVRQRHPVAGPAVRGVSVGGLSCFGVIGVLAGPFLRSPRGTLPGKFARTLALVGVLGVWVLRPTAAGPCSSAPSRWWAPELALGLAPGHG